MRMVSWNVNGLRACMNKGFMDFFQEIDADIFCVQEIKMLPEQLEINTPKYYQYINSAEKKGYSGTMVFTKKEPLKVTYGIQIEEHDHEGRVITCEYESFYLVCVYTPNSKEELSRLAYRMKWEDDFRAYVLSLAKQKSVIVCGDLNVAHQEIDLKNPKTNHHNAGFSDEERKKMSSLLESGFTDSYRLLYPNVENVYSWWSYRFQAREKNAGWRIDYFLVSNSAADKIQEAKIHKDVFGSDHCPISLEIDL